MNNGTNMRVMAVVRLVVTLILCVNAILTANGINPIPFDENAFTEVLTQIIAGISVVWAWWKNNNITNSAIKAQKDLNAYKVIENTEDNSIL